MKDKIMLPFQESLTSAWPENNFLNSIIQSVDTGYKWLMNTHIQIYGSLYVNEKYHINERRITFYPFGHMRVNIFDLCPFIRKYCLPRKFVKQYYSYFSDFLFEMLEEKCYVFTSIQEVFKSDGQINHPCYFVGYNKDEGIFYAVDNFEHGKYKMKEVSFEDVNMSFDLIKEDNWDASVFLYEIVEYKYQDSIQFMSDQIQDYLNSGDGMCYMNRFFCPDKKYINQFDSGEVYLGVESYQLLYRELTEARKNGGIDIRSFSFLTDHKKIMLLRNTYLVKQLSFSFENFYESMINDIYKEACIILNLVIKYNLKRNESIIDNITDRLDNVLDNDVRYLKYVHEKMNERISR